MSRSTKSRRPGSTKKGGAGGRFTWGKAGEVYDDDGGALDEGDPLYDELEDGPLVYDAAPPTEEELATRVGIATSRSKVVRDSSAPTSSRMTLPEYKAYIAPAIREYFVTGDIEEFSRCVSELNMPLYSYEVVKRTITMSFDQGDRERELASKMISDLYGDIVSSDDAAKAFERLFEAMEDLELDAPDAKKMLANFLARAVVDEVLPPSFLNDTLIRDLGGAVVEQAKVLLSVRRSGSLLGHVWGLGGADAPIGDLKASIRLLVEEFFEAEDLVEAAQCVRELGVPHYHHEVVKRGMVLALDRDARACELISTLFTFLFSQENIERSQFEKGFDRVRTGLADLTLDNPAAPKLFHGFVVRAKSDGILEESFDPSKPTAADGAAEGAGK